MSGFFSNYTTREILNALKFGPAVEIKSRFEVPTEISSKKSVAAEKRL